MARKDRFLTEKQWRKIEPLLPARKPTPKGGRPPCENREVLEGILWILRTGAPWADLPKEYPSASTCWRRLSQWQEEDIWLKIWSIFLQQLDDEGKLDWYENFGDGYFSAAKKGALQWEKPSGAKAQSFWWWSTVRVFQSEIIAVLHPRMRRSWWKKL